MENRQTGLFFDTYNVKTSLDTDCVEYLRYNEEFYLDGEYVIPNKMFPMSTTGDGNCLLHAISNYIFGIEVHDYVFRNTLTSELINYREFYKKYCNLDQRDIKEAKSSKCHLSLIHIFALSNAIARPIILISSSEDRKNFGEGELSCTATFLPTRRKPEDCSYSPVIISWSSSKKNHFVPLIPVEDKIYINIDFIPEIAYKKSLEVNFHEIDFDLKFTRKVFDGMDSIVTPTIELYDILSMKSKLADRLNLLGLDTTEIDLLRQYCNNTLDKNKVYHLTSFIESAINNSKRPDIAITLLSGIIKEYDLKDEINYLLGVICNKIINSDINENIIMSALMFFINMFHYTEFKRQIEESSFFEALFKIHYYIFNKFQDNREKRYTYCSKYFTKLYSNIAKLRILPTDKTLKQRDSCFLFFSSFLVDGTYVEENEMLEKYLLSLHHLYNELSIVTDDDNILNAFKSYSTSNNELISILSSVFLQKYKQRKEIFEYNKLLELINRYSY